MSRILLRAFVAGLALFVPVARANADVLELKGGQSLGGAGNLMHWREGAVLIVDASGTSLSVSQDEVVSMKLDGLRRIKFNNGDVLRVDNVTVDEGRVSFTSEILGENVVPFATVTAISPLAGEKIVEAPPLAEEEPTAPRRKWSGNVQFAYTSTSGREDTQNANVGAEAVREGDKTRLTFNAAARFGETDGNKTVDAQEASGKLDYFLTKRDFLYGQLGALRDSINLIDLRLAPGIGIGRRFIASNKVSLEGEAGTTMIWERQSLLSGEKETESEWHARIAGRFRWQIAPGAEFSQLVEALPGLSSTEEFRYRSISQLTATLTRKLSLAAGFTVDYDGHPPEGVPHTSTNANTGFIYNF